MQTFLEHPIYALEQMPKFFVQNEKLRVYPKGITAFLHSVHIQGFQNETQYTKLVHFLKDSASMDLILSATSTELIQKERTVYLPHMNNVAEAFTTQRKLTNQFHEIFLAFSQQQQPTPSSIASPVIHSPPFSSVSSSPFRPQSAIQSETMMPTFLQPFTETLGSTQQAHPSFSANCFPVATFSSTPQHSLSHFNSQTVLPSFSTNPSPVAATIFNPV